MILSIILTLRRRCGSLAPHPTTLPQERPFSKTVPNLFTTTGKMRNFDEMSTSPPQRGTGTASDNVEISDPCPEAREKLQEMCRHM